MKSSAGSVRINRVSVSPSPQSSLAVITVPEGIHQPVPVIKKAPVRPVGTRDNHIKKDAFYTVHNKGSDHIVSENYSYKTETYYTILKRELDGDRVLPTSRDVLDAYVVP
ncbi:MAG: hypothetical protein WC342_10845, partial [Methanoregula sp.]